MKVKLEDMTIKQVKEICRKTYCCEICPLCEHCHLHQCFQYAPLVWSVDSEDEVEIKDEKN